MFLWRGTFINLHTNFYSCIVTVLQQLRHFQQIALPSLFHNCRQVMPSRRTTKSPRHAVQLHRQYDDFCRALFCQQQRLYHGPAGVRHLHCQLHVQSAQVWPVDRGFPFRFSTRSMSRVSTGPGRFSSRTASTISTLRYSGDVRRLGVITCHPPAR